MTAEEQRQVVKLAGEGKGTTEIAQTLGLARSTVYSGLKRAMRPPKDEELPAEEWSVGQDGKGVQRVRSVGTRIKTVEEALEKAGLDGPQWKVRRAEATSWEVGMKGEDGAPTVTPLWRVMAVVEPVGDGEVQWERVLERTLEQMKGHEVRYEVAKLAVPAPTGQMLELDILDTHLGLYTWAGEVGKSYDSEIAETMFMRTLERLLRLTDRYQYEQVVFPVGNDFFHADNEQRQTSSERHVVDIDTRATKVFETGKMLMVRAIERLLQVAPRVVVPVVPGNHDRKTTTYLGHVLAAWYRTLGDRVQVDFSAPPRKYVKWGQCLIGYEHGADVQLARLPMIMAHERPQEWAATTFRRWRVGHKHSLKRMVVGMEEVEGVEVWQSRALCPADAWSTRKGFVGVPKGGSATVWDKDAGPVAEFTVVV